MKVIYSAQAQVLIKELKNFDRADFEAWFFANLPIGDRTILEYLSFKNRELKNGNPK